MKSHIKVLIIDDHDLYREWASRVIKSDPDFELISEAASATEILFKIKSLEPDLILIDLNLRSADCLEILAFVKKLKLQVRCIVWTNSNHKNDVLVAMRAGADGYLLKDIEPEELCINLKKAISGITVINESLKKIIIDAVISQKVSKKKEKVLLTDHEKVLLTDREKEILACLAQGFNNKSIALALGISISTIKLHIKHLLSKLNLASRLEAAVWEHKQRKLNSDSGI